MFRFTQKQSSESLNQCLAKNYTFGEQYLRKRCAGRRQFYGCIL